MTDRLKAAFEPPVWLNASEVDEYADFFPELSKLGVYSVAGTLGAIERHGDIADDASRIFEFGSGQGEGLIALDMFAKTRDGAIVKGSERAPAALHLAMQVSGILERVAEVDQDGLRTLSSESESFDVILANMFGPSYHDEILVERFVPVAMKALSSSGVIIINSDWDTMKNVYSWTKRNLEKVQATVIEDQLLPRAFAHRQPHIVIKK